jgi:hypothetical protein
MRKILAIVFQENRPFSVVTDDGNIYDVEFCAADETLYYHCAGSCGIDGDEVFLDGGRNNDFWLDPRFKPKVNPGEGMGRRLELIDGKWLLGLDSWGEESDTVYCTICDDNIPTAGVDDEACDHIHWDGEFGWWAGEGYQG